jgi:hypothetical protein
MKRDMEQI